MGLLAGCIVALACFAYIFWPQRKLFVQADKTRVDSLQERKEAIYANLRDLSFEYQAGKYPEEDYAAQRGLLEEEAAAVMAEMDALEAKGVRRAR